MVRLRHNVIKTLPMLFNIFEEKAWKTQNEKIWNEVESQLLENMMTELIKKKAGTSMVS